MKLCLGLFLLLCCGTLHLGSGLRCYKCSDYTGRCQNVQECTYEDSCISLSERATREINSRERFHLPSQVTSERTGASRTDRNLSWTSGRRHMENPPPGSA